MEDFHTTCSRTGSKEIQEEKAIGLINMTDTATAPKQDVYVPNYVKASMPSVLAGLDGDELYIVSSEKDIFEIDKKTDADVYYVLMHREVTYSQGKNKYKAFEPSLFKRIRINVAEGLVPIMDPERVKIGVAEEYIIPNLPLIPFEVMDKVIHFFREVHKKYSAEAIVVLAYDFNYLDCENEADGWVVFVPKQSNTAASCDYDATSIMEERQHYPDAHIVGTIHSHPMMDAFASTTDVRDQRDKDGLHITVAWHDDDHVSYHCEIQLGNHRVELNPREAIEIPGYVYEDKEVASWMNKVEEMAFVPSKAKGTGLVHRGKGTQASTTKSTSASTSTPSNVARSNKLPPSSSTGTGARQLINKHRPTYAPDIINNVVVMDITDEDNCPICGAEIGSNTEVRRCIGCMTYMFLPEDKRSFDALIKARRAVYEDDFLPEIDFLITGEKPTGPILLLKKNTSKMPNASPYSSTLMATVTGGFTKEFEKGNSYKAPK